jgi:hypothetical protein
MNKNKFNYGKKEQVYLKMPSTEGRIHNKVLKEQ